jgi:hypothetical protein
MIKQNKTTLRFILGGILMLTLAVTACNNGKKEESKDATKDSPVTTTPPPPAAVKEPIDTMEKKSGNVAPGNDNKPTPAP